MKSPDFTPDLNRVPKLAQTGRVKTTGCHRATILCACPQVLHKVNVSAILHAAIKYRDGREGTQSPQTHRGRLVGGGPVNVKV